MCRRLLVAIGATALASTSLVLAPETAVAQHYGRGGELRGSAAGTWRSDVSSYGGWAGYRGATYGYHRGSRWIDTGWLWAYPGYYGWGAGSPYYSWGTGLYGAYYPYYSSSLDTPYYSSMYAPVYDYGYFPSHDNGGSVASIGNDTAHVIVQVPDPEAELWFQGLLTSERGTVREFDSPSLTPNHDYVYEIRARWSEGGKTVDRTQQVHVQAGHEVTVNFARS